MTNRGGIKKEKAGFWCPDDVDQGLKALTERGAYQDRSKAIVALLREALQSPRSFPPDLEERFAAMVTALQRDREIVLRQCVEGILEMIEAEQPVTPLVVQEVQLRQLHYFRYSGRDRR